ncbi:MAG: redoxin domain-containing protein, partial [Bacteroidota bacterium]|nr:redoxin domain-containing protein [Bacteroidota bacterium]
HAQSHPLSQSHPQPLPLSQPRLYGPSRLQPGNDSVFSAATLASFPLTVAGNGNAFHLPATPRASTLCLFVFLSPECPLCQNYTVTLNALHKEYGDRLCVYGIIPGKSYSTTVINAFAQKYKIAFPLLIDGSFRLSRYLQAGITPEAILLDDRQDLLYAGAIDNWVKELGKRSARPTEYYLRDAIDHALKKEPVAEKRIRPVGCLINDI